LSDTKAQTFANSQIVDSSLIKSAQAGDRQAMAVIYKNYSQAVYGLLFRMVWEKDIAQELMQDTFIDVMTKLSTYRTDSNLYAWIRKVAVNNCLMYFRKNKKRLVELCEESHSLNYQAKNLSSQDSQIDVQKLLKKLTPKRRLLVWLHEVEGMTHKEIADVVNKSVSYSKTELSRALSQLREYISEEKKQNFPEPENINLNNEVAYAIPCQ